MKVLGIIAEYNPMHDGHIYQIKKLKKEINADYVIIIMSGNFTEAGNISVLNKYDKADIAIKYGADMVIELPTIYASSSAEMFTKGAINLLYSLGIVTHIGFGAECNKIEILTSIANKLIAKADKIDEEIKKLDKTNNYAKNRSIILNKYLKREEFIEISKSNNILGIEYIRNLILLKSDIKPLCIKRINNISSSKIREQLANGNLLEISKIAPPEVVDKISSSYSIYDNLYILLRNKIANMNTYELKNIYEVAEGLENKFKNEINTSHNYNQFINNIKSKRYLMARIKRIIINILLDIDKTLYNDVIDNLPLYAHVLKINKKSQKLLSKLSKKSKIPIITSYKEENIKEKNELIQKLIDLDIKASNLYSILSKCDLNKDLTNNIISNI